jgi:hypothetical protein
VHHHTGGRQRQAAADCVGVELGQGQGRCPWIPSRAACIRTTGRLMTWREKEEKFFLKKEPKTFAIALAVSGAGHEGAAGIWKSFCFFFSKKKDFLFHFLDEFRCGTLRLCY